MDCKQAAFVDQPSARNTNAIANITGRVISRVRPINAWPTGPPTTDGTQYVSAAGAIAVIAPQIGGQRKWRDICCFGTRAGHGGVESRSGQGRGGGAG